MQVIYTNDWKILVANEFGETLKIFNWGDEDTAYNFFLSCLNSEERADKDQRIAQMEIDLAIDAEDAANRRLSSDHYSSW